MILTPYDEAKRREWREVLMPSRAFIDSDGNEMCAAIEEEFWVLMPSRAFIDSDPVERWRPREGAKVLMPSRAFIDSDKLPNIGWKFSRDQGLNALTGIY